MAHFTSPEAIQRGLGWLGLVSGIFSTSKAASQKRPSLPGMRPPHVRKDDHVQEPLDGAIIHALDPGDFVRLILQDVTPAAASRHGDGLALCSGWTLARPLPG